MVVAGRDTESSFLTTTRDIEVSLVLLTKLLDSTHPVGVLVPVVCLGPRLCRHVVDFVDSRSGRRTLGGVIELLLQHHGVVVTIQQFVAGRHPSASELIAHRHPWFTASATLGGNLDNTVSTLRTPDSRSGSILQHGDAGNIVHADSQHRRELLLIHILRVEVSSIVLKDLVIDNNQRLGTTTQRRDTTQTHRSTGTKVTRVGNDIQTGDLTLQGLIGRGKGHTFHLSHIHGLL